MKKMSGIILPAGMILAILISNIGTFISDGRRLDSLRGSVLRLHIIANSDGDEDQRLKLCVRDALLAEGDSIFGDAESLAEAEAAAEENLPEIVRIAERTLREEGCRDRVQAEIADVDFDERTYGSITMPAGKYRALRVTIGEAKGHNWWCVMYPPLCIPAACGVTDDEEREEEYFSDEELDILRKPKKYRVRFAIWDKMKRWFRF
ncbi:MAG: stage II sporulation protein R [Ruminococcus sp.]|nr:stage II sporulation protein R [Ruminococcus sp.]